MSEWVGKNIPDSEVVASRKPSMSFIYSKGRDFYGIYRFPAEEPEKLVNEIKQHTRELIVIPNNAIDESVPIIQQLIFKSAVVAYAAEEVAGNAASVLNPPLYVHDQDTVMLTE